MLLAGVLLVRARASAGQPQLSLRCTRALAVLAGGYLDAGKQPFSPSLERNLGEWLKKWKRRCI